MFLLLSENTSKFRNSRNLLFQTNYNKKTNDWGFNSKKYEVIVLNLLSRTYLQFPL